MIARIPNVLYWLNIETKWFLELYEYCEFKWSKRTCFACQITPTTEYMLFGVTSDSYDKRITRKFNYRVLFMRNYLFFVCNHVTRRPCWWSIQKEFFCKICIKIEFISQRRETLLFLTTNMAAVTSLANKQYSSKLNNKSVSLQGFTAKKKDPKQVPS